jgi:hypothetical protein
MDHLPAPICLLIILEDFLILKECDRQRQSGHVASKVVNACAVFSPGSLPTHFRTLIFIATGSHSKNFTAPMFTQSLPFASLKQITEFKH